MNATIHPAYDVATITCTTCGTEHVIRSTRGDYSVEICAECHPFYTGTDRPVASGGRIERFQARRSLQRTAR